MFLQKIEVELINTAIVLAVFLFIRIVGKMTISKIGKKSGVNDARINLISRYYTVTLLIIFLFVETYIFGAELKDISLVFSSVFAVIGIGLFAIWSILSNVTSGIIMFFSFPYKVGDKIKIHDKDYPIEAVIEDIRAFQLHLRVENGDLVTYPNNLILQKAVTLVEKDAIEDFGDFH
ncbi:mechanosensitive ion channel-like protein [Lacinutrix venerupis]|uniref:Mechanosensitive ion channel protein MscS n=1 Tax=Lacinutrix venerupis TaxID=1486034 RepID=A0AAC9LKL8_9FLAO|nr:mechanosensitive ion channel domain-containing protein [Lacinutrix venerupis]APY00531.1 mechanosensitive ion channel protein MscS [Lacinutrix venerupis]RLJ68637.1 mechanosensitive ion channel-like protein [Lacinutrix venerupis]